MDVGLLKAFLEINRVRHFGRAANNLFISQSAVSARIKQLEDGLIEMHGSMPLPEAIDLLGLDAGTEEDTVGGYITALLGRLPKVDEVLTLPGYEVKVLEVTDRRVERIQFAPTAKDEIRTDDE